MSVSFDDLFDEPVKPTGKAAPKNAAISFDDLFDQPPARAPLKSVQAQPWELGAVDRFTPPTRSAGRGQNMPSLGSQNNPYPAGAVVPDNAYVKTADGGTVLNEVSNMEALGGILARGGMKAKEMASSFIPTSNLQDSRKRLDEIKQTGGYTVGLGDRASFVKATPEDIAELEAMYGESLSTLGANREEYNAAAAGYPKSSERLNLERNIAGASGLGETLSALADPSTFGLLGESMVSSTPMIAAAALTRNPAYLAAIGGIGAGSQEFSIGVADYLEQNRINPLTATPEQINKAIEYTNTRTGIVGGAGALGNLAAGTRLIPDSLTKTPAKAVVANAGAQSLLNTGIEGGGEAAAGAATGNFNWGDTLLEAAAGGLTAPVEAAQVLREAAGKRGQQFPAKPDQAPEAELTPAAEAPIEITPEVLGAIGQSIEAKAEQAGQQQAEAQRSFTEAGTVIDTTLSELEAATKPRLDKAEAKALQAELQDIAATLKEQADFEKDGVLRSPENNLSDWDKAALIERQIQVKTKLEAHRAAGSAESQLRELQSKLSKVANDNELLALANSLSPPVAAQGVQSVQPAQGLGEIAAPAPDAAPEAVAPEPIDQLQELVQGLGDIGLTQPPSDDLDAYLANLEKSGSQVVEPAPLSAGEAPESQTTQQGESNEIFGSGISKNATGQQTPASEALNQDLGDYLLRNNETDDAGKPINPADVRVEEIGEDGLPDSVRQVKTELEKIGGAPIVIITDQNSKQKLWFDGVFSVGGTIYVNSDSQTPFATIAIHEFLHKLRKSDPDLYDRLAKYTKESDYKGHAKDYNYTGETEDKQVEELTANAMADALSTKAFIKRLSERDPTLFADLAKALVAHFDAIVKALGGVKGMDSSKYMKDVRGFRAELLDVMTEAAKRQQGRDTMQANNGAKNDTGRTDSQVSGQANAGELQYSRPVGRSPEPVELDRGQEYRKSAEGQQPTTLAGLPKQIIVDGRTVEFGGFKTAQDAAKRYMEQAGLKYNPPTRYAQVDTERAQAIADEFSTMAHNPSDPQTKRAYEAMIQETLAQYQAILETGLKIEFIKGDDPYGNPRNAIIDIVENNHFWVFPTDDGFGSGTLDVADNPLLAETEYTISGKPALANDIFRVVHDYFGHAKEGVGFRATGEENAWRSHSAMYSPLARRAMTTETRGQNSWVNYGEFGEQNRKASPSDTVYADQKVGLLPEWVSEDGAQFSRKKGTMRNEKETSNPDEQSGVSRPDEANSGAVASESARTADGQSWLETPEIIKPELVPSFRQNKLQPEAVSVYGVHYSSKPNLEELDSKFAGTGSMGAERRRFGMSGYGAKAPDGDTARRLYFYIQTKSTAPAKEDVVAGATKYRVRMENLYDTETDPLGLAAENRMNPDAFEEAVVEAGFDGAIYDTRGFGGITEPTAILFGLSKEVPVQRSGVDPSFSRKKVESSKDWTFSPLARMVDGAPLKSVAADQWKKWIAASATKMGVKADELEYTGINEWLDLQQGKVSKEAVSAYLDAGGVQVNEVLKREEAEIDEDAIAAYIETYVADEASGIEGGYISIGFDGKIKVFNEESEDVSDYLYYGMPSIVAEELGLDPDDIGADSEVTKFGEYRPAGGENYRELLLTLPERNDNDIAEYERLWKLDNLRPLNPAEQAKFDSLKQVKRANTSFNSSHWDEPNILTHIRFDDRKDADGNKVLFINEIQSDWGQQGRKDGFNNQVFKEKRADGWYVINNGQGTATLVDGEREADAFVRAVNNNVKSVPKAPFVTDTKAWVGLAIKRMIRYAVDNNIDRIAFINGEQAADLYDLSKQVRVVEVVVKGDVKSVTIRPNAGVADIGGFDVNPAGVVVKSYGTDFTGKNLSDVIGKDLAEKVLAAKESINFTGLDLKVGGEGMKAFYDRLVPQVANDVLKKLGGGKVETIDLSQNNEDAFHVEERNGKFYVATDEDGNLAFLTGKGETSQEKYYGTKGALSYKTLEDAQAMVRAENIKAKKYMDEMLPSKQLGFTIPQAMRDKVASGDVPLFARRKMLEDKVPRESDPIEPDTRDMNLSIDGQPVRFAFGNHTADHQGFGMKHIVTEVEKAPNERTPPKVGRDMAEDLVQQAERILLAADEVYRDRNKRQYVDTFTGRSVTLQNWDELSTNEKYWSVITILPKRYVNNNKERFNWELMAKKGTAKGDSLFPTLGSTDKLNASPSRVKSPARVAVPLNYTPERGLQWARRQKIGFRNGKWQGLAATKNDMVERYQDRMVSWKKIQDQIEKSNSYPISDAANVYQLENLMHGKVSDGIKKLERSFYEPISKEIDRLGLSTDDVQLYLIARHAPERNASIAAINPQMPDGGSGVDTADANAYMAALPQDTRRKLDSVARRIDALIEDTRSRLLSSGMIDQAQYNGLKKWKYYVPLRGKQGAESFGAFGAGGVDVRGKMIRNAMGRGSGNGAENVLGEVIGDSLKSVVAAERATVGRSVMLLVNQYPSPLWQVDPIQTERYINSAGEVAERTMSNMQDQSVLIVKNRGKSYAVKINDDRLVQAIKAMDESQLAEGLKYFAKLNRYFSAVLTQYNPAFVPVNAIRDFSFGLSGLAAEHGAVIAGKAAANYAAAARAAYRHAAGKPAVGTMGAYADEHAEAGGQTGYMNMDTVEELQQKIRDGSFGSYNPKGLALAFRGMADFVSEVNSSVENALRLSAYAALRESGMSKDAAAAYTKNMTVNFNRKGRYGANINSIILFYNAAMQGAVRSGQLLSNPKVLTGLAALGALQALLAMVAMGIEDDETGEPLWNTIPDYVKRRNLVIPTPSGTVYYLPLQYGFNVFPYMAGRTVDALTQEDERPQDSAANLTGDFASALLESFFPVPLDEGAMGLIPQFIKPFLEIRNNEDGLGRRIRDEPMSSEYPVPRSTLGRPDTPEAYKGLAKGMNRMAGGTDYVAPAKPFNWAPEDIEHLVKTFTGGAGQFVMDTARLGEKAFSGLDITPKDIPIAKRFVSRVEPSSTSSSLYYARREEIGRKDDQLRDILKRDGKEAAREFFDSSKEFNGARMTIKGDDLTLKVVKDDSVYGLYKAAQKAAKAHRELVRAQYDATPPSLLPSAKTAERSRLIRESELERAKAMSAFNRAWLEASDE